MNEEGRPTSGEKRAGGGVWLCCVWLHQLVIFYGLHCLDKALYLSRKLAVASWSYSCFSKGRGRPESNTVIFHSEPLPSPLSSRGILKQSWKQMVTGSNPDRSLGNLYSAYQNPIIFQAHMHLSFRSPSPWASGLLSLNYQIGSQMCRQFNISVCLRSRKSELFKVRFSSFAFSLWTCFVFVFSLRNVSTSEILAVFLGSVFCKTRALRHEAWECGKQVIESVRLL